METQTAVLAAEIMGSINLGNPEAIRSSRLDPGQRVDWLDKSS